MGLARVFSRAAAGVEAPQVTVEVHLGGGLPQFNLVGLPETSVRESRDRVRAAVVNSGFEWPQRRITVSLAPAELPKDGGRFDLPIALGILAAAGQVSASDLESREFLGELSLAGELRQVHGCLPAIMRACQAGRCLVLPEENGDEAGLVRGADCRLAETLTRVCSALNHRAELAAPEPVACREEAAVPDLADVRGQHRARRALEVAAAGGHNLLFIGPPGTGKTMLASRLPGILPPMNDAEALEAASVLSVAGRTPDPARWRLRPFRSPHHTASAVALVGGGGKPRPGEISLAHRGILFLDELPEFSRKVLEVLREPLESGSITISRAALQAEFPASFQLVAAMNPCPCGYRGDPSGRCRCTPDQINRYRTRLSGPLLDRIDLQVEVPRQQLREHEPGEDSVAVRQRVVEARQRQVERAGTCNAWMAHAVIDEHCKLQPEQEKLLEKACERLDLSARAHHRILRVARTIADLDGHDEIGSAHLSEALGYRQADRSPGGQAASGQVRRWAG